MFTKVHETTVGGPRCAKAGNSTSTAFLKVRRLLPTGKKKTSTMPWVSRTTSRGSGGMRC